MKFSVVVSLLCLTIFTISVQAAEKSCDTLTEPTLALEFLMPDGRVLLDPLADRDGPVWLSIDPTSTENLQVRMQGQDDHLIVRLHRVFDEADFLKLGTIDLEFPTSLQMKSFQRTDLTPMGLHGWSLGWTILDPIALKDAGKSCGCCSCDGTYCCPGEGTCITCGNCGDCCCTGGPE